MGRKPRLSSEMILGSSFVAEDTARLDEAGAICKTPPNASPAAERYTNPLACAAVQSEPPVNLSAVMNLTEVSLNAQGLADKDADAIVQLINAGKVKKLMMADNALGDVAATKIAACLSGNTTLNMLSMHGNKIGREGGRAFALALMANATLKSLYLSDNPNLDAATINEIQAANQERAEPMSGLGGLVIGNSS